MTKAPTKLGDALAKKAGAAPEPAAAPDGEIKTLTLRLPIAVHDQLREMSFSGRRSQHALLMDALNLLFEKHNKPPIAPVGA